MTGAAPAGASLGQQRGGPRKEEYVDVVIVGGGNAGFCAAHAARESGASVLLLEKAPTDCAGGNSYYTAGAFRVVHDGADTLAPIIDDRTTRSRLADTVLAPYPAADFTADMERLTDGRCDPDLTRLLVDEGARIPGWLARLGMRWRLMYERQAYYTHGRWVFFGGLALGTVGGGKGLIAQHTAAAHASGVSIVYGAAVTDLVQRGNGAVLGVTYEGDDGRRHRVRSTAVVLAAGGFEADRARRARNLGEEWSRASVRGNPLNTGEVLDMALAAGAAAHGDWCSCHSVAWDIGAPAGGGDRELTNQHTRQSYPIGIVVNKHGERFVDEGADYRNYTYARYGREILLQPEGVAFQLFDAKTRPLLRVEEYDSPRVTGARADSLDELAVALGVDAAGLRSTVAAFNASIATDKPFYPAVKDGRSARVRPPKSNWAQVLDTPPFYGFGVTCGITFTFGGVRVDDHARVLDAAGRPVAGLYAAGEIVGGLFSGNYPGGSGLTAGAVFGRLAGEHAAARRR